VNCNTQFCLLGRPNLFFGMTSSLPGYSLITLGPKKPGQVTIAALQ
jgi:hypothetical protein